MAASSGSGLQIQKNDLNSDVDGERNTDMGMEEDMDLTEDDFRNVSGQFSGIANACVPKTYLCSVDSPLTKTGVKRARTISDEQQPSVHVTYKHLTRASKQKLESLLQQWSEWEAEQNYLSEDEEPVLESGDETYFPALRVGLQKTSSVSFWFDCQTGRNSLKKFVPVESSTTPLYNRGGFTIGLDSADGSSNLEGGLEIIDDPPRCFNCGAYSHSLRECTKPFDRAAVSIARRQHKSKRNQTSGSRLQSRYYQSPQGGKYDGLKPGSLDAETRQLLGLGELDPPPWLHRMREIGYPPGYLAVEDDHLSGITIFGEEETKTETEEGEKEEGEVTTEDGEILEKASPQEPQMKMTVEFPGINAPIPENADSWKWEQRKSSGHGYYHDQHHQPRDHRGEMGPPGVELSSSYPPRYVIRYDHGFGSSTGFDKWESERRWNVQNQLFIIRHNLMLPLERYRGMMPTYLNPRPNQSDIDMFNQELNMLPNLNVVTSDRGVKYQMFLGETFQPETGYHPSKRQRIETQIKLNRPPWNDSLRLPSLQVCLDPTSPVVEQKVPVPMKSFEEVSSCGGRCFHTPTTPVSSSFAVEEVSETVSGGSDVTKLDVMDISPLDDKHVQGLGTSKDVKRSSENKHPTRVYSLEDLFSSKRGTQEEEKPKKQEKLDVVEPMKCDEQSKCEAIADTASLEKRNKRDVSLVERFTEEEIRLHIKSFKEGSVQGGIKETAELKEEPCQLCGEGPLMFPAVPIYCSLCSRRIKEKSVYYIPEEKISDAQHQLCNPCHTRCRSKFSLFGISITKANMLKKNNAENQDPEEWVCCGSCGNWQHQICGLYNLDKDIDKTGDYICPYCLLEERKSINNTGFLDNTDLGAKDLPETILSHFIEQRLFKRLKEERHQTAKATGKSINDVSEPNDLTLRVVFSADKNSYVNKNFAEFLQKEHYPSEFPYRSKVILLFQKVEGVDICIFALFIQEFGSECSQPNQRSIYILYLDSVKYFRPERVTFSGEALRTFVYHEILIGYLEYCKIRGFTTGYIWACPPPKGEDYIMYSHPKTQQTPNTKKLRQWYVSMLDKAVEQRVVTNVTNLYERFFVSTEESTCNITAARLPYFEGSFWSYNAELLVQEIEKEGNSELQKKVKSLTRRALKGMMSSKSKDSVDADDAKNILLMQKLEKMISQNKEDFMVVELNYSCTRCSEVILSGLRWFCEKCKNLQLCERCHDAEQELPREHTHTVNGNEKHRLSKAQVNGIQSTTEDNDVILENNMLESRQAFLGFSQKHNYSFDTLRRAKHSSMMILHHLHTSNKQHHHCSENSSRLFQVTCTACEKDVSKTIYYSCLICSGYRACTGCFTKNTTLRHNHLFPMAPTTHGTPPKTVGSLGVLDALLHAVSCRPTAANSCSYPKCNVVKTLFNHSVVCEIKDRGACNICMNLWKMLRVHAYHCYDPTCPIPRCRDMKEHFARNGVRP
ncbi:unnamed protein product [Thlaspi arvense]|uniref:histone acetyltransferase n=1 Tax=Thlaspi arvense TaxID=13288 RepID=A0AAU9SH83_THLAR|nr:unnamed protein product [Thlaspi arvense]